MTEKMYDNGQFGSYDIDVCLCIDKTGSMDPIMDTVKQNALNLYDDIVNTLNEKHKHVGKLRIRVIWFGDYRADENPMLMSDFMDMPEELDTFKKYVQSVSAYGGGDAPEDGLEALTYAIRSDWCSTGWKRRHIIAMFTDAPAHELGFGKKTLHNRDNPRYPEGMPSDFSELSEMWGDEDNPGEMDYRAKRLLLFTPDETYWHTMATCWENVVIRPVETAAGLADVSYQAMMNTIANSV